MKENGTDPIIAGTYPLPDGCGTRYRCLECGENIVYGRTDKKFCCAGCKNRWHNRQVRNSRIFRMRVMSSLDRNYRILSGLVSDGVTDIEVSTLSQMGFSFTHVTSYRKVRRHTEMWCFDIKFVLTETWVKSISRVLPVFMQRNGEF